MARALKIGLLVAILIALAVVWTQRFQQMAPRATVADGEGLQWVSTLPETPEQPMIVYFTASWCGPCQVMKREAWVDREVVEAAAPYLPIMIDVDEQPELAAKFTGEGVPTVVLFDAEGNELDRMVGYGSGMQEDLATFLRANAGYQ